MKDVGIFSVWYWEKNVCRQWVQTWESLCTNKFMHNLWNPVIYWVQPQQLPDQPLRSSLYWAHGVLFLVILTLELYENGIRNIWGQFKMCTQMTSKRRSTTLKNQCIFDLKRELMPCNGMCHSSCKDIFSWKIKQVFLHWTIKNIASFSYEAVRLCKECNPKIDCSCINLPYSGSPKMNDFLLRMSFILKNVGLKFDKASLNTLYNSWINLGYPLSDAELS